MKIGKTGDPVIDRLLAEPFKPRQVTNDSKEARQKRIEQFAAECEVSSKGALPSMSLGEGGAEA